MTSDRAGKVRTDYIYVDDGYIDYSVSACSPDIVVKAYTPEPVATQPSATAPASPSQSAKPGQTAAPAGSAGTTVKKVSLAQVKGLAAKKKGTKKIVLKWKKVPGAKKYQVLCSTDKKLKKSVKKSTAKKNSITIKRPGKKKKYYIKVRACAVNSDGSAVYGKYSKVVKVKF